MSAPVPPAAEIPARAETWGLLHSEAGEPAWNMALDEALLEAAARLGHPVLRCYSWTVPAATFGYFQRYAEVERLTPLRPLIRRPTGGGVVPHDGDWTYSLVFPPDHGWYGLRARASYERLHRWMHAAFRALGFAVELAGVAAVGPPAHCFQRAEQFDVLLAGAKIAGAAQRRTRQGLLIQGSVQPPPGSDRAAWELAFCRHATQTWHVHWQPFAPEAAVWARAEALARDKYRPDAHHRRR